MKFSPNIVRKICWMGIPLAAQNALGSVSGVICQSVVNSFGSTVMSAYTAASRVEQLVSQPYSTMGVAVANFAGQNVGAGKFERVKTACRKCVYLVIGFSAVMFFVMLFFGRLIIGWFVEDASVIDIGARGLLIMSTAYFFMGLVFIYKAMLNGAGDAVFSMGNGVIEVGARLILIFGLTSISAMGYWGIWWMNVFSSMLASMLCVLRYRGGKWMKKSVV